MGVKAPELKSYRPNAYDGFDLIRAADRVLEENLAAQERGERWPHGRIFIPERFRKPPDVYPYHVPNYYSPNVLAKCTLWGVFHAARLKGLARLRKDMRRMEGGTFAHQRLQGEFRRFSLGSELLVFDFENRINGYIDMMLRNYETAELIAVDFKHRSEFSFRRIKRAGLAAHLKYTRFYPALPDDAVQVMLYIWMFRRLVHDITHSPENIERVAQLLFRLFAKYGVSKRQAIRAAEAVFEEITFGWRINKALVIAENQSDHDQRKASLVEFDQEVVDRLITILKLAERYVDDGTIVDWSGPEPRIRPEDIPADLACHLQPVEAYVHRMCPYRNQCPIGIRAMLHKGETRDLPLYVLLKLKQRKREAPELASDPGGPQLSLISETPAPEAS